MEPTKEREEHDFPEEVGLGAESELAGLDILIVEDMGLIAMELRLMLAKVGCEIIGVASRLNEAVKLAQATDHLDGVLLDLNLSGESSYPVAEILHERGVPFIIMSGHDASQTRADCANDAHLQKPFNHDELARMMARTFLPRRNV